MLNGSLLQKLVERQNAQSRRTPAINYGVYYKNTLVALCHALEDSILESDCNPVMIAAFQQGKWYLQEADRYGEIADKAQNIVILAAPNSSFRDHPTSQKANVELVSLDKDDPVAQEWHLLILSPGYTAMVLCQELSDADYGKAGVPEVDLERKFYGFWTFEPELVLTAVELAIEHIQPLQPDLAQSLQARVAEIDSQLLHNKTADVAQVSKDLNPIVSRVVRYLSDCHEGLGQAIDAPVFTHQPELERNIVSNKLQAFLRMAQLIDLTDLQNPHAASEVSSLCEAFAQILDLPSWQVKRLRLAGLLHRIDYLPQHEPNLGEISAESRNSALSCPLYPGRQALRMMPQLKAIAQIITHQSEYWDGSGTPGGLSYDEIPLECRILGLLVEFQRRLNQSTQEICHSEALSQALSDCQAASGQRWDPKLVEMLTLLVMALQQGMTLPREAFKLRSGLWLLNPEQNPDLFPRQAANPSATTA
ncbi:DICT sensory domain-containing protein [Sodalinema gerasimenkoae]|uniref:DICT sensory domain-containing protein n=1 Tax=Sodalinema gerasimenkoae TaxID=2862348 RepID=UPI00135709F6|nr:DICT sensory domain-containing protein [Sodalinema gerasimenkoae]